MFLNQKDWWVLICGCLSQCIFKPIIFSIKENIVRTQKDIQPEGGNNLTTLDLSLHQFRPLSIIWAHLDITYHFILAFHIFKFSISFSNIISPMRTSATGAFFFTAFGNRKRFFFPPNDLYPFLANSYLYDRRQYGHRQTQFIFACCFSVRTERASLPLFDCCFSVRTERSSLPLFDFF